MEVDQPGDAAHAQGLIESFDYPGEYDDLDHGKKVASLRTRQERGRDARIQAEGDIATLSSGLRVTLAGDPVPDATGLQFLCLAATHTYRGEGFHSGSHALAHGPAYTAQYVLMPVTQPTAPRAQNPCARGARPPNRHCGGGR